MINVSKTSYINLVIFALLEMTPLCLLVLILLGHVVNSYLHLKSTCF